MESALHVDNVTKDYGQFTLKNVSFDLPKGSIMGLVGENGAGKTTILKLILNLIKKDEGAITVLGLDHIKDEQRIKEQIGIVFDESHFHGNLTIHDVAKIHRRMYRKWDEQQFSMYVKKLKLPEAKIIKEFSKGMKMKLSIAVALSHHPKLLLLDEATSGLDPIVRDEILDLFLDFIQDEECSILFSSHITSDLEKVADYITFIHNGELVFSESKDDLLYHYGILKCGKKEFESVDQSDVMAFRSGQFGYEALVRDKEKMKRKYRDMIIDPISIEEMMVLFVRGEEK